MVSRQKYGFRPSYARSETQRSYYVATYLDNARTIKLHFEHFNCEGRQVYRNADHCLHQEFCAFKFALSPHSKAEPPISAEPTRMKKRVVVVNDRMQSGYRYELAARTGRDFHPEFRPQLTPKEMLELGVFCGKYMTDCRDEFPESWFRKARLSADGRDCTLNFFGIDASQPLSVWRKKGWLHPDDPRGWFQWYCRYYMGRRLGAEDLRQIKRWSAIRRHVRQIEINCERGDLLCRRRQRQALLHWAYDSRKF
jgi:hypothetical protein